MAAVTKTPRTPALDLHEGLAKLATYPYQILTFVDPDGYPVSVAVAASIDADGGSATFASPAGLTIPTDADVSVTGSHIRPQPGYGYDERRHVTVWGRTASASDSGAGRGAVTFTAARAWG